MEHRSRRVGLVALQIVALVILVVALYDCVEGDWVGSVLGSPQTNPNWVTFFATIVQVSLPIAVAAATVPFLIGTFSRQETTRIGADTSAMSWWARASLATAVVSGCLAMVAAAAPTWSHWDVIGPLPPYLLVESLVLLAVATQIEFQRLDPYRLASLVAERVSVRATRAFGLVRRNADGSVTITRHNLDFATRDPIGPFHELMSIAWTARDRVLVLHLLRRLSRQATDAAGVVLVPAGYRDLQDTASTPLAPPSARRWGRRAAEDEQIVLLVHILHYLVRNARTSSVRWGGSDGQRRIFTLCLLDLYVSLSGSPRLEVHRRYCLHALVHQAVQTLDLPAQGDQEPFTLVGPLLSRSVLGASEAEAAHSRATAGIIALLYPGGSGHGAPSVDDLIRLDAERRRSSLDLPDPWGEIGWHALIGSDPAAAVPSGPGPAPSPRPKLIERLLHAWRAD